MEVNDYQMLREITFKKCEYLKNIKKVKSLVWYGCLSSIISITYWTDLILLVCLFGFC